MLVKFADNFGVKGIVFLWTITPKSGVTASVCFEPGVFWLGHGLHPEDAESCWFDRRIQACINGQSEEVASLRRVNHAIVPESGT